jgi:hypothetical protein
VAWKEWLAHRRNRRLARIAREKGLACPDCGSSDPVPTEGGIGARPDGGAHVRMRCEACEGASVMALVLSPEEAESLGLHSLGERPEEPGPG